MTGNGLLAGLVGITAGAASITGAVRRAHRLPGRHHRRVRRRVLRQGRQGRRPGGRHLGARRVRCVRHPLRRPVRQPGRRRVLEAGPAARRRPRPAHQPAHRHRAVLAWVSACSAILFFALKATIGLRVSRGGGADGARRARARLARLRRGLRLVRPRHAAGPDQRRDRDRGHRSRPDPALPGRREVRRPGSCTPVRPQSGGPRHVRPARCPHRPTGAPVVPTPSAGRPVAAPTRSSAVAAGSAAVDEPRSRSSTPTACCATAAAGCRSPTPSSPVVDLLVRNLGRLVGNHEVRQAYDGAGGSGSSTSLRSLVHRLGRRVAEVGLRLHVVRSRGLVLDIA